MEARSKGETFLGFAVKAGKFRTGANTVSVLKKAYLVIVCKTATENCVKQARKDAKKHNCPLVKTAEKTLEELVYKPVKTGAVTDAGLAKAIILNLSPCFERVEEIAEEP